MIHIGQTFSPMRSILPMLKRGDIVTHMYAPAPNGILDDSGRVLPDVLAARRRGVWFDFGNGVTDHFNWDVVERAMKQGFAPDTFSTDWNTASRTTGVIDFANVMSKFLTFGMPLDQVIARATCTQRACSRPSTTAARSIQARRPMSRCSSCGTDRSNSSTTTRVRGPVARNCFRSSP